MVTEFINRVKLAGKVGLVKIAEVGYLRMARFSMATQSEFEHEKYGHCEETTWHNCIAYESPLCRIDELKKGAWVSLEGRIRNQLWTDEFGEKRFVVEVIVGKMKVGER